MKRHNIYNTTAAMIVQHYIGKLCSYQLPKYLLCSYQLPNYLLCNSNGVGDVLGLVVMKRLTCQLCAGGYTALMWILV